MKLRSLSSIRLGVLLPVILAATCLPAAGQTGALKLFKGTITNSATGKPIDGGRLHVYEGSNPEPVTTSKINPSTGFYQVILSPATEYRFEVASIRFYHTEFTIRTPAGTNYEETVKDLKVDPIPMGTSIYSGVMFDPGSSKLNEDAELRSLVNVMKKERGVAVTITVTPDVLAAGSKKSTARRGKKGKAATEPAPGPTTDFKQLGEARMAVIKNFLKQQGISTARLNWDLKEGATLAPAKKKGQSYPDNVVVRITSIQADDETDS